MPRRRKTGTKAEAKVETASAAEPKPVLPELAEANDRMTLDAVRTLGHYLSGVTYDSLLDEKPVKTSQLSNFHKQILAELKERIGYALDRIWIATKVKFEGR